MKVKRKIRSLLVSLLCAMLLAGVLPTAALAEDQIPTDNPRYTTGVSRSKTATPLDTTTWTSDVTLSLPSAEEKLDSDVVFVLDGSSSADSGVVDASLSLERSEGCRGEQRRRRECVRCEVQAPGLQVRLVRSFHKL